MIEELRLRVHAVERFRERVRPDLSPAQARQVLEGLLERARWCRKPRWVHGFTGRHTDRWLALAPGVVAHVMREHDGLEVQTVIAKADRVGRRERDSRHRVASTGQRFNRKRPRRMPRFPQSDY